MQFKCIIKNLKYKSKHIKVAGILELLTLYNVFKSTALIAIFLNLTRMKTKSTLRVALGFYRILRLRI
jgi:hypothetical protein